MEKKVRRQIQFNNKDFEKMKRFILMYEDMFQTVSIDGKNQIDSGWFNSSRMDGYEHEFVYHMSKKDFEIIRKAGVVKKIRQAPYKKDSFLKDCRKDIWVLCE